MYDIDGYDEVIKRKREKFEDLGKWKFFFNYESESGRWKMKEGCDIWGMKL